MTDPFSPPPGGQTPPPYGAPQYGSPQYGAPQYGGAVGPPARNGFGVASLVLGILAIFPLDLLFVPGILAVIFGILGRRRAKRGEATNGGVALAGAICGLVGLLIGTFLAIWLVALFNSPEYDRYVECDRGAVNQAQRDDCTRQLTNDFFGR